ncbi:MAG: hypothetical protein ACT4OW_02570, partial [Nitrososphaerota archaeon]
MQDRRMSIKYYKNLKSSFTLLISVALFFFSLPLQLVAGQDETDQNESVVNDLTRQVIVTTVEGKTVVEIKTTFSINTISKDEMINEAINNFA